MRTVWQSVLVTSRFRRWDLAPQIVRLARENIQINLAVSLHAPDDATRSQTMPINRRYPISVLLDACRRYVEMTDRRIFFEYVLLQDQNDRIPPRTSPR